MTTLAESYEACRALNRRHGTTYYWSTLVLPADKRPFVHALYGFARYADDIVDDLGPALPEVRSKTLAAFGEQFFVDLERGDSDHQILKAVVDTVHRFDIAPSAFERFLHSMTMDLTVESYATYEDLEVYMDGSAAVIGEMMLPILEPAATAHSHLTEAARTLGIAFQLTNFLRDVGEDLDRGRVYVPQKDIAEFGADPYARVVTPAWRSLMQFEIARNRALYVQADAGIDELPRRARNCIRSARKLYSRILDEIEAADYDVFSQRVRVPTWRKAIEMGSSRIR